MAKKRYKSIFSAIVCNDIEAVKSFLPDQLELRDKYGRTPLLCTCDFIKFDIEIVRLLLDRGADIKAKDNNGRTPMHLVCDFGHTEIARLLINYDADIESQRDDSGCMPLHYACRNGNVEIVSMLLDRNTNIEARDKDGWTPLHISCAYGNHSVSEYLVSRGADPFINTNEGYTAITYDKETVKDEKGNEIPHRDILIQLRAEYLNKRTLDASERTAALSSGWEMEL